jgi:PhnB protein
MPVLDSYLFFNANCAEAMRFYQQTFGGKLDLIKGAEAPAGSTPPGMEDLIMHARLEIDGRSLMASDWMDTTPYPGMHGFSLSLGYTSVEEAQRIFAVLADGGKVNMPMSPTFWSQSFGMLIDRFGTPWMIGGPSAS